MNPAVESFFWGRWEMAPLSDKYRPEKTQFFHGTRHKILDKNLHKNYFWRRTYYWRRCSSEMCWKSIDVETDVLHVASSNAEKMNLVKRFTEEQYGLSNLTILKDVWIDWCKEHKRSSVK